MDSLSIDCNFLSKFKKFEIKKKYIFLKNFFQIIFFPGGPTFETTLHEAIRRKNLEIIEFLLSKGASMKIRNGAGKTAEELGRGDPKIKRILDKFKNEHVLQPGAFWEFLLIF